MSIRMPKTASCAVCNKMYTPVQRFRDVIPEHFFCSRKCQTLGQTAEGGSNYKSGGYVDKRGYVYTLVSVDRYALEHRLVAARLLGRPLIPFVEQVIHLDENPSNNAPENLFVFATKSQLMKARLTGNYPTKSNLSPLTYEQLSGK